MKRLAHDGFGVPVAVLALAWVLANPAVHSAIVGTRREKHIQEAVQATGLSLGADDLAAVERILAPDER
jgi:aryl-alcohol dehydrogenase-like predicted oxidoreductase